MNLSYHTKETIILTIDPYYGSLNPKPQTLKGTLYRSLEGTLIDSHYGILN